MIFDESEVSVDNNPIYQLLAQKVFVALFMVPCYHNQQVTYKCF